MALREGVVQNQVKVLEVAADVDEPTFAIAMADHLHELIEAR